MAKPKTYLTLFFFSFASCLIGQILSDSIPTSFNSQADIFSISFSADSYRIDSALHISFDNEADNSIQDVNDSKFNQSFQPFFDTQREHESLEAYWGRVLIKNDLTTYSAPSDWVLSFSGSVTSVDVLIQSEQETTVIKAGSFLPVSERNFTPLGDANMVKFSLPREKDCTIYYRAFLEKKQSQIIRAPKLYPLESLMNSVSEKKRSTGFFVGFMAMILIYSLSNYFFEKDAAYLFYAGYLGNLILWFTFNSGELESTLSPILFPENPQYVYFFKLATYTGIFCYLAFINKFMHLKEAMPRWSKIMNGMIWVGVPLMLWDAYTLWSSNFSFAQADRYSIFYILSFVLLIYVFLWPLYKTKDKKGYYIICGMLCMAIGFMLTAFFRFSNSGFSLFYFQVGTFFEVAIFALGLSYRRRLILEEKQKAEIDLAKNQLQKQKKEEDALRLQELDSAKNRLYTNITHEFRTPLTVIMGMAEILKENKLEKKLILRNAKNLLRLINQMLDLSKLDTGGLKTKLIQGDIIAYIQYLTESFYSMASDKKVQLNFSSCLHKWVMDFDEEKIQHIIYNLLSNAIKFTKPGGNVFVEISKAEGDDLLHIKVKDTGIGISEENIPHIFNRFYQVAEKQVSTGAIVAPSSGTGIGLALTKELVELLGGQISVNSELRKGTEFLVTLPHQLSPSTPKQNKKAQESPITENEVETFNPSSPLMPVSDGQPMILIIEDNAGVVRYIQSILSEDYSIHIAENGQEGIDKAFELVPDIIITDVMMPMKNGFEVCEILKKDERTSHIPIVMLTAKADLKSKIEGLSTGADAYLSKPFEKDELLVRLRKLLELRHTLQAHYIGKKPVEHLPLSSSPIESKFLKTLKSVVEERISDDELSVEDLHKAVFLSHTQMYRKLKALTGQTPSQFIRSIRLRKSMELLKNPEMSISEISYEVGFSNPNYFSRMFKKEFGKVPGEARS